MTGFSRHEDASIVTWRGDPSQVVHDFLLEKLQPHAGSFITSQQEMTEGIRGNLGEFTCFWIGQSHDYESYELFTPANAFQPLARNSRTGLDLLWMVFAEDEADDFAVLQEVKLTGDPGLAYASALPVDYAKLFGTNPALTLQTRLEAAKNELEFVKNRPELVPRVTAMGATSPAMATKIRLVPTLVHDDAAPDPEARLQAVRTTIVADGWDPSRVGAWSVALDTLDGRLLRLAMGQS